MCKLAYKYGTDKCPKLNHVYTPFYYKLFNKKRKAIKKVFEMGIGGSRVMKYIPQYQTGASLRMWRDFFPNAHIYGADYDPELLFEVVERISPQGTAKHDTSLEKSREVSS